MTPDDAFLDWLEYLSPSRRAAQLLIVAPDPDDEPDVAADWFLESGYGGLFLQWRHLGDREWLFRFLDRLRDYLDDSPMPLITVDEEGGLVSDLNGIVTTGPSPAALGVIDDAMTTFQTAVAMGNKIRALVVLAEGNQASDTVLESIRSTLRRQLAPYKLPHKIEFTAALPKSALGKILRAAL